MGTQDVASDEPQIVALVDRAVAGDAAAFGQLYVVYANYVYHHAFHSVWHHQDAENITGDVFVKAWQSIGAFKWQGATFRSWLFRITTNAVIDCIRQRQSAISLDRDDQDNDRPRVQVASPDAAREFDRLFDAAELDDAFAQVTEEQRDVLEMRYLDDMDHDEIAECLARRQGAIRAVQMRGLIRLRRLLAGPGASYPVTPGETGLRNAPLCCNRFHSCGPMPTSDRLREFAGESPEPRPPLADQAGI